MHSGCTDAAGYFKEKFENATVESFYLATIVNGQFIEGPTFFVKFGSLNANLNILHARGTMLGPLVFHKVI